MKPMFTHAILFTSEDNKPVIAAQFFAQDDVCAAKIARAYVKSVVAAHNTPTTQMKMEKSMFTLKTLKK